MTFTPGRPGHPPLASVARSRPLCVAKGVVACFVFLWVPASAGMTFTPGRPGHPPLASVCSLTPPSRNEWGSGVLCFSLDSRVRGNDVYPRRPGHPPLASVCSLAPPSRREWGSGVLCFSLDSRVRGNDGRWAQRPSAGMTFTTAAPGIRRSHRFARSRPLRVAKGGCCIYQARA